MVVDVSATHKAEALDELVSVTCKTLGMRRQKQILDDVLKREESASTYVGQGVALPHARVPLETDFAIAVGRNPAGVAWDAARGARARIVVLLLTNESLDPGRHLQMLGDISALFKHAQVRQAALSAQGPVSVVSLLTAPAKPPADRARRLLRAPADTVVAAACRLARHIKAKHLVAFADAVASDEFVQQANGGSDLVVICSNKTRFTEPNKRIRAVIYTPPFPTSRFDQMKIGILLALSRGLLTRTDKVVCISGNPKKGVFDTIVVLDIATEYDFFYTSAQNILPPDVKPEVLERVLGMAAEIAVEGREGKPLGTIFVIGDTNTVNGYVRQLIINPFRGYSEGERNILDPGLDETVKEFAAIDGAFVITGEGIVLSAGSYLRPQVAETEALPSGLGARHMAAAGITACTNALAVTVSESTGMVSLFKGGVILMTISKPVVQERGMVQKML